MLTIALFAIVKADPTDQGPQMFEEAKATTTTTTTTAKPQPQKQHKRQQNEQIRYKEVIMYLTPSQIRALESGQSRIEAQPMSQPETSRIQLPLAELPLVELPKSEIPKAELPIEDPYKALQNSVHEEGQTLQREYENFEADRKHRIQLTEAVQLQPANEPSQLPQTQTERPYLAEQSTEKIPGFIPHSRPPPGLQEFQYLQKPNIQPQNYAYLYFYPNGKPANNHKLKLFYPELDESRTQQLASHQEKTQELRLNPHLQQKFHFVPYEYTPQLQAHVDAQQLLAHRYESSKLEAHRLEQDQLAAQHLEAQLEKQNLESHKLEAEQYEQHQLQAQLVKQQHEQELHDQQIESHRLHAQLKKQQLEANKEAQQLHAQLEKQKLQAQNEAQQLHVQLENQQRQRDAQQIHSLLEQQKLQAHKLDVQQFEMHALHKQLEGQLLQAQELQAHQLEAQDIDDHFKNALQHLVAQQHEEEQIKAINLEENQKRLEKFEAERVEAEKLKEQIESHQREAQRLDEHLEALQLQAEKDKAEAEQQKQQPFQFIGDFEPKKSQMYSLFSPLLQRYNLEATIKNQKTLLHKPKLESGFVPSQQYAPKYNNEKYIKEVEKILRNIHFDKQNSLAKATAIAKAPPVVVKEEVKITKRPIHIIKHVNVPIPAPFYVPVPEPFEVKVPQPYAVPLEIIRPIPIPIVKTEKLEVEKPVPFEVEKHVPYPVTKNVFVNVDKPYFVKKIVPVEIQKEIPVEIPIHKPQKLSIIRHIWEH